MGKLHRLENLKRAAKPFNGPTFFSRTELNLLLSLYSRRVMNGEWRDYAIDQRSGTAIFSVYRHSHEHPLYTIAKRTGNHCRGPEYLVCRSGEKLVRTADLEEALAVFRRKLKVVS
jgi:hypothetical protein